MSRASFDLFICIDIRHKEIDPTLIKKFALQLTLKIYFV